MPRKSREDGKKVCPSCAQRSVTAVIYCEPGDHDYQGVDVFAHEGVFSCPDHSEILRAFAEMRRARPYLDESLSTEALAPSDVLRVLKSHPGDMVDAEMRFHAPDKDGESVEDMPHALDDLIHRRWQTAKVVAPEQRRIHIEAHDSGDGETIFHCPFCLVSSTSYLTRDGVKTLGETAGTTQMVLTADPNDRTGGRWVEAHIHEFGEQPIMRVVLQRNQQTKVVEATPEHRWLVKSNLRRRPEPAPKIDRRGKPRGWRPTHCARGHEFVEGSFRTKANGGRECLECARLAVAVGGKARSTDRFLTTVELRPGHRLSHLRQSGVGDLVPSEAGIRHGVVFGDGSAQGRYASVSLWGEKDKQLLSYFPDRRYKDVTTADRVLGTGVPGVHVSGDLWAWMKSAPEIDSEPSYLYGWLAGYFAADGSVSDQGQVVLSSANKGHLEIVKDIALRLGIATYGISYSMREGFPGREPSALFDMEFVGSTLNEDFFLIEAHRDRWLLRDYDYERFGWTVVSVEETGRVERVYCAVVPGTHTFALEDHIWTGNCGSGQVTASSDGTVECDFCKTRFTVQVQPQQAAMPQTIDGTPQPMPGMPGDPTRAVVDGQQDATQPPGAPEPPADAGDVTGGPPAPPGPDPGASPGATPPGTPTSTPGEHPGNSADKPNPGDAPPKGHEPPWLRKKKQGSSGRFYLTAEGFALDEEAFQRHLAIRYAQDRDGVLRQIKAEKESV